MIESYSFIDIVVIGEGEGLISDVLFAVKDKKSFQGISGIVFRNIDGSASKYTPRERIENLDEIPFPARNLFRQYQKDYRLSLRRDLAFRFNDRYFSEHTHPAFAVMFTTRGCPYQCKFCCAPKGRRVRSPKNVVAEIEECIKQEGIRVFVFYDDLFVTGSGKEKRRVIEFCNLLKEKNINIYWEVELRADVICKLGVEILRLMNQTGCSVVNIGIEKGSQEGLDFLNKQIGLGQIIQAVQLLREAGSFIVNGSFILGGSNERRSDIFNTIDFAIKLGLNFADFHILEIHPGTDLFVEAQESGLISDHWESYQLPDKYPLFVSSAISKKQLLNLQKTAYRKFYFRKDYIFDRLKRIHSLSDARLFFQEYAIWTSRSF